MEKQEKKQVKKKKKKRFRLLKVFLVVILILLLAFGGFVVYSGYKNGWGLSNMIATVVGHDQNTLKNLDEFRVLLLGVSTDTSAVLTDTIMVASYNPRTQKASLLSIPRDTYVGKSESTANSYDKINAMYQTSTDKILKAVNDLTGLNLQYYVVVDTQALIALVDEIGGVQFNVPIDMDYDDSSQDLHIHLKAGPQLLDGEKAENLVRFRHNNDGTSYPASYGDNDIGRMRTQREFITQVAKQTIQLKNIGKIGEIVDIAYKYIETNVTLSVIKDYIPYAIEFNTDNIQTGTIPGTNQKINGLWFLKANKTEAKELINQMFEVEQQLQNEQQELQEDISENNKIKIEVLNGTNANSTLSAVTTMLKQKNYKISKTGETTNSTFTTIIANGETDEAIAEKIKDILGVGTVLTTNSTASKADITIIIGNDFNK